MKIDTSLVVSSVMVAFVVAFAAILIIPDDDPVSNMMEILDKSTTQCAKEIETVRHMGQECHHMMNVADKIFEGHAGKWGKDMARIGAVNESNIDYVSKVITSYVQTVSKLIELEINRAPRTSA